MHCGLGNWGLGLNSEQPSSLPDVKREQHPEGSPGRPRRAGPGSPAACCGRGEPSMLTVLGSTVGSPERAGKPSPPGRKKKMGFLLGSEQDPAGQRQWLQEPQQLHPC